MNYRTEHITNNYETTDFENSFQLVHRITEGYFPNGTHIHTCFYEIHVFLRGKLEYVIEGKRRQMEIGDVTVIAPGEIHRTCIKDNSEYERVVVHITEKMLSEISTPRTNLLKLFKNNRIHFLHFSPEELEEFLDNARQVSLLEREQDCLGQDILLHSYRNIILLQILRKLQKADPQKDMGTDDFPPLIGMAVEFIKEHLTENISVQSIAEYLNVSRSCVSHSFKVQTGYALWDYVISKRLILSQKLIMEGRSVTEACYDSGFRDYAHFIKSFTKTFGISPKKYREQMKDHITVDISMRK